MGSGGEVYADWVGPGEGKPCSPSGTPTGSAAGESGLPHFMQKRKESSFDVPHLGQIIRVSFIKDIVFPRVFSFQITINTTIIIIYIWN